MNPAEATRQIYWNISHIWLMYLCCYRRWPWPATVSIAISIAGAGSTAARFDRPADASPAAAQTRARAEAHGPQPVRRSFHRLITYGFIVLTIATMVVALDADFGTTIMRGNFYLYFQSFIVDIFGALVMVGVAMAARVATSRDRRSWFTRPRQR